MKTITKAAICIMAPVMLCTHYTQQAKQVRIGSVSVIGKWALGTKTFTRSRKQGRYDTVEETVLVQCNACPEVRFKSDGTGVVYPEGSERIIGKFSWKISGNMLSVTAQEICLDATALNGVYSISNHKPVSGSTAIELIDKNKMRQLLIKID